MILNKVHASRGLVEHTYQAHTYACTYVLMAGVKHTYVVNLNTWLYCV